MLITNFYEFNYIEINILNKFNNLKNKDDNIIDINWNEEYFNKISGEERQEYQRMLASEDTKD